MPTPYSPEERERITWAVFVDMENGKSLTQASKDIGISEATILRWIDQDETGELSKEYARARDGLITRKANELIQIADDLSSPLVDLSSDKVGAARLQIDARKWALSKLMPKKFGDKIAVGGSDDMPPLQSVTRIELVAAKLNDDDPA